MVHFVQIPLAGSVMKKRDSRIDVLRGFALFMIFADHIPFNGLAYFTLHNFTLCDAAEVFVLVAGMSATLAYGKKIERDGWKIAVYGIARRCRQIYVAHVVLVLSTLLIGVVWLHHFNLPSTVLAPILQAPTKGVILSLILAAQPDYLNILPLYIVLLALFPVIWLLVRRSIALALLGSASLWILAAWLPIINLPNWTTGGGWFFDPFSWQFLLTVGIVMAQIMMREDGDLPWHPALGSSAAAILLLSLPQSEAWHNLGLPALSWFAFDATDKMHLAWPRVASVVALGYLIFSSRHARLAASSRTLRYMQQCGQHSLEVFVTGCVFALLGRLLFRVTEHGVLIQLLVNSAGMAAMIASACWCGSFARRASALSTHAVSSAGNAERITAPVRLLSKSSGSVSPPSSEGKVFCAGGKGNIGSLIRE